MLQLSQNVILVEQKLSPASIWQQIQQAKKTVHCSVFSNILKLVKPIFFNILCSVDTKLVELHDCPPQINLADFLMIKN